MNTRKKMTLTTEQIEKRREHMRNINKKRIEKKALEKKNEFEIKYDESDELVKNYQDNPVVNFKLDETIITHQSPNKTKTAKNKKVKLIKNEEPKPAEIDNRGFISRMLNITEIK